MAAYGVIANLSLVVMSIYTGIAQGIQPLISGSYGKGCASDVQALLRYALTTVLVLSAAIYIGVFFGADTIAGVFNSGHDPLLQGIAVDGLKCYFTACGFAGINIILSVYFYLHGLPVARSRDLPAAGVLYHHSPGVSDVCPYGDNRHMVCVSGYRVPGQHGRSPALRLCKEKKSSEKGRPI